MNALEMLIAQGIPQKMAERIIAQANAEPKEKKAKKFFPGMSTSKAKIDLEVDCLVICECCGASETIKKVIKAYPDTEQTSMKLPVSCCTQCPAYFRAMTHEQLVSLAIARHNPNMVHAMSTERSLIKYAKNHTPEEVLDFKIKRF